MTQQTTKKHRDWHATRIPHGNKSISKKVGQDIFFFWNGDKTSLLIRTQSIRELYKDTNKEVVIKGVLEGSGGTPRHFN